MYVNIIDSYRYVVAICDKELIGKKFEQGKLQLDIKENFYKKKDSKPKTKEEVLKIIEKMVLEDATFNIVGENSILTAIEARIISKDFIKKIHNIPYAMTLL